MDTFDIKQLTIEYLLQTSIGDELEKLQNAYENIQTVIQGYNKSDDSENLKKIKFGTITTFAIINKVISGKKPSEFTDADWKEVANFVDEYAFQLDGRCYSTLIFKKYAEYIDWSLTNPIIENADKKHIDSIRALADELRAKIEALNNEEISEVSYVDDCLWISLEAMIKLLSTYAGSILPYPEFDDLLHAITGFAFEYGRMMLWRQEQALLEEYINNQYLLDEELQLRFEDFKSELDEEAAQFNALIEDAFTADFRQRLRGSVELALAAGVNPDEVLDSVEKIDEYFM